MIMVVLYHCTCYYAHPSWPFGEGPYNPLMKAITIIMGGIHMPVFVYLSGYLFWMLKRAGHYDNILLFYKNKTLRILIPYVIWGIIMLLIFREIYSLSSLLYGICHLWYLLMLFVLFLLSPVLWLCLEMIKNDRIMMITVLTSFLLFPVFCDVYILQITKIFYFLPIFLIGYVIQRRGIKTLCCDWLFWVSIICVIIMLRIFCPDSLFYSKVLRQFASFFVIIAISLIPAIQIPYVIKGAIKNISENSMGIYLIHHIIISYVIMIPSIKLWLNLTSCYIGAFVLFLGVFICSWILSNLFNRFNITRVMIGSKI